MTKVLTSIVCRPRPQTLPALAVPALHALPCAAHSLGTNRYLPEVINWTLQWQMPIAAPTQMVLVSTPNDAASTLSGFHGG
jgi:hypothetical protein